MARKISKANAKVRKVMHEFKTGSLHSGRGKRAPIVKSRRQAIAIALSMAGRSRRR